MTRDDAGVAMPMEILRLEPQATMIYRMATEPAEGFVEDTIERASGSI